MDVTQSTRLAHVRYDIRGPVLDEAMRMRARGEKVLELNIGNPAPFGFEAPAAVLQAVMENLPHAHGYGDSKGLASARVAVADYYGGRGIAGLDPDDIFLGNGVSELIAMSLNALLDPGDEVLVPAPDYPLWTAGVTLAGGRAVHYFCDERAGWMPDLEDLAAKVSPQTKAVVLINPNNPTGAVYPAAAVSEVLELARRHNLVVFSDEIYDRILYDGTVHTSTAALAPDLLCLTFSGLSKVYRVAGFRTGWLAISGPKEHAQSYLRGLAVLASLRLCPNTPTQYAIAPALASPTQGPGSIGELLVPGGRLAEQRDTAWRLLDEMPGVSCVKPLGAFYAFPRLDPKRYPVADDQQFVLDLLRTQRLLVVQGSGFNWPKRGYFRVVTLPTVADLEEAMRRLAEFLAGYGR